MLTAWYKELPPVTRCYLTASVAVTALCYFEIVTLFQLYLDFKLIAQKWQWWRLVTNFLFFGDSIGIVRLHCNRQYRWQRDGPAV